MSSYIVTRRVAVLLMTIAIAGAACGGAGDADNATTGQTVRLRCDSIHDSACTARLGEREVTLTIRPRPVRAMEDLTFEVTVSGEEPAGAPHIDLNMEAMDMGPNRVALKPIGSGRWTGTGVIVRCPSGKKTWVASVTLPSLGTAEFVFDAVY